MNYLLGSTVILRKTTTLLSLQNMFRKKKLLSSSVNYCTKRYKLNLQVGQNANYASNNESAMSQYLPTGKFSDDTKKPT